MGNRVFGTSEILQAYDSSGHTQTVQRVLDVLDDLGGDDVTIVERHGTAKVVFADELVKRLQRLTRPAADHAVVIGGEA